MTIFFHVSLHMLHIENNERQEYKTKHTDTYEIDN